MVSGKKLYKYLLLLGSTLILSHCSVEKNTGLSRFYQSLTARDNIYFNGVEAFKKGIAKVETASSDNFSEVLKVFKYSDKATAQACTPEMETTIQKASKVISLKSITARPESKENSSLTANEKEFANRKEFNEWVDDSYLLMAKARFYKHEFDLAGSTFEFCVTDANDISIRTEAAIWLARIANETGDYSESLRRLNNIEPASLTSRDLKVIYYTTLADLFIKQKKYNEAIAPLTTSLDYITGKQAKYRLTYLLAQLNGATGNLNTATALYRKVVNMNPPYDVEFNARINMAGVFDITTGDPGEMKDELTKMLKDSKNKEFRDQIYYVLGDLSAREGKEAESIDYYHKSAAVSTSNRNQKGKSYLAMASYYYKKPDYLNAQKFYDSTIIFLDSSYPDYQSYRTKSVSLNELVSQLNIVQKEDSLQRVALMSPAERSNLITSIINKVTQDEMAGVTTGSSDMYNLGEYYQNEQRLSQVTSLEGKWYFYNQSSMTFGRSEFRRRWGERQLEDNWRRSNKSIINPEMVNENDNAASLEKSDSVALPLDNKNPDYYLKNLPVNDSLIRISNERIATSLFNAARVYSDRIEDPDKAIETYQLLISRFPVNGLIPEAVYNIYSIYKTENNSGSEKYRQLLLEKYPDTEYARIISDPDYYNKKKAELGKVAGLYEEAYNEFIKEDFNNTVSLCSNAIELYKTDELAPKFSLLRAYATARIKDERAFKEELTSLIKEWPGTEESKRASEIIAFLNNEIPELKVEEDKVIASEIYVDEQNAPHLFVLIIQNPAFNLNQATFDVINYNIDNYTNKNYRAQGSLVDDKYFMITVGNFINAKEAMDYYNAFKPLIIIRNSKAAEVKTFVISTNNLQTLNSDKDLGRYQIFFESKYMNSDRVVIPSN